MYNPRHGSAVNLKPTRSRKKMKIRTIALGLGVVLVCAASGVVWAQKAKSVVFISADKAKFVASPQATSVSMAALWGDHDKSAHGTLTKFEPGYDAGMHAHTNEVRIVVIKGAYLYKDDAGEKRVGPGDYLSVPGGHKHWSGGDKTEGALFYEEGSGKFDIIPVK
jgi:quercetin dioxygenase-like cupin family protein